MKIDVRTILNVCGFVLAFVIACLVYTVLPATMADGLRKIIFFGTIVVADIIFTLIIALIKKR